MTRFIEVKYKDEDKEISYMCIPLDLIHSATPVEYGNPKSMAELAIRISPDSIETDEILLCETYNEFVDRLMRVSNS